jgi:hypothetical protein
MTLAKYEAARAALAEARRVDEVKEIRNTAEAMRAYARMAKDIDLELDAAELRLRAERRLGELMAAQRDAGLLSEGGRPKTGFDENPVSGSITLDEAGIDKNLAHRARTIARIEEADFEAAVERVREKISSGDRRVSLDITGGGNLRAAIGTDSATAAERGNNLYETPVEAVHTLLALERFSKIVREPACGRGAISRMLEAAGHNVILSDIVDYGTADRFGEVQGVGDFLRSTVTHKQWKRRKRPEPGVDIVTNPPYGRDLNAFVAHALRVHRPRKMALLLNLNFLCGFDDPDRNFVLETAAPSTIYVFTRRLPMMHRDGWDGPEASSRMNCAWFVWQMRPQDGTYGRGGFTQLRRVDWKDYLPAGAEVAA